MFSPKTKLSVYMALHSFQLLKQFPFCEFGEGIFSNSSICISRGMLCVIYTVLCILSRYSISAKELSVTYLGWLRGMLCAICILCISAQGILYDTYGR